MAGLFADIRYVLFDWGGTLCSVAGEDDTWRSSIAALLSAGKGEGLPLDEAHTDSLVRLFLSTRAKADADPAHKEIDLVSVLGEWLGEQGVASVSAEALERMSQAYWQQWVGCLRLVDGAAETLGALRERGYRLGLVSNVATPPHWCRRELKRLGLWELLDCVTFSSEVGVRKPHPRVYQEALSKLGDGRAVETSRVLFVGDSPQHDVGKPAELGMRTALVRDRMNRWPASHYQAVAPDLTVDSLAELLPRLPGPP